MKKLNRYLTLFGLISLIFFIGCFGEKPKEKSDLEKFDAEIEKQIKSFFESESNGSFLKDNTKFWKEAKSIFKNIRFDLFKKRRGSFTPTEDYYFDVVNYIYGLYRLESIIKEVKAPISPCEYYDIPQLELKRKIFLAFDDVGEYLKENKMELEIISEKMDPNGKIKIDEKNNLYINKKFDNTNFSLDSIDHECVRTIAHELYHLFDINKNGENFYKHPKTEVKNCKYYSHKSFLMEYGATGEMTILGEIPILTSCESNDSTIVNY